MGFGLGRLGAMGVGVLRLGARPHGGCWCDAAADPDAGSAAVSLHGGEAAEVSLQSILIELYKELARGRAVALTDEVDHLLLAHT